ncbi:transporter substrate-binding domain-containing protein, partial [Listeria monocytogenes]|nr:transporter substrate-binding domain-containing protein [Listeria monocytogenes]
MQKHLLQKFAAILLVFIVVFSGFTSVFAADTEDQTLAKIQEKGVLTVGLSADYPPYEFHQTIDGKDKVVGFDVSIAEKIAKDLDV